MNVQEEMRNLEELHASGAITDAEFEQRKAQLLNTPPPGVSPPPPGYGATSPGYGAASQAAYSGMDQQTRQWAMILHLSQFAGYIVPFAGLIAPIVIWQVKKNELPGVDEHGKVVTNWILSELIYFAISFILIFLLIGIPLMMALGLMAIIFPIIGGIKANNGELWKYPLSIPFFK